MNIKKIFKEEESIENLVLITNIEEYHSIYTYMTEGKNSGI